MRLTKGQAEKIGLPELNPPLAWFLVPAATSEPDPPDFPEPLTSLLPPPPPEPRVSKPPGQLIPAKQKLGTVTESGVSLETLMFLVGLTIGVAGGLVAGLAIG